MVLPKIIQYVLVTDRFLILKEIVLIQKEHHIIVQFSIGMRISSWTCSLSNFTVIERPYEKDIREGLLSQKIKEKIKKNLVRISAESKILDWRSVTLLFLWSYHHIPKEFNINSTCIFLKLWKKRDDLH